MQTYFKKHCWIKRRFKNKACSKNIRGTSNCQPALPRLQIRTRGLCWKHTKNLMSFFSLILKKQYVYIICWVVTYSFHIDWYCLAGFIELVFNPYSCAEWFPRFLCTSPGYLWHLFEYTNLVNDSKFKWKSFPVDQEMPLVPPSLMWNNQYCSHQLSKMPVTSKKWPISYRITSIWTQKSRM